MTAVVHDAQPTPSAPADGLVCVGRIVGAHGVRGQVRLVSYTEDPASVASYGPLCDRDRRRSLTVRLLSLGRTGGREFWIAAVDGVADRTAAEALAGLDLYVPRSALPATDEEDAFYHADLIGLEARATDGTVLGRVAAIHDFGAGDVIEIAGEIAGRPSPMVVPFTRQVVPVVDIAGGHIVVEPPHEIVVRGEDEGEEVSGEDGAP